VERRTVLLRAIALIALVMLGASAALWRMWAAIGQPPDAQRQAYIERERTTLPELWDAPQFTLPDEQGTTATAAQLHGQIWIADFIFTTCTAVCPRITANMVLLQRKLETSNVRFVSFSVDPEHDTVAALAAYKKSWNPDESRWSLLSTTSTQLSAIADAMRVAVEPSGDATNPILHSNLFFLVDALGKVRGVYDSADAPAQARLVEDVQGLLSALPNNAPRASSFNPQTGRDLFLGLGCAACHDKAELAPPLQGLAGRSIPLASGEKVQADRKYVETSLLEPGKQVVAGYLQLMPSYAQELHPDRLALLVDYLLAGVPPAAASSATASANSVPAAPIPLPAGSRSASSAIPSASAMPATSVMPSTSAGPAAPSPQASIEVDPVCGMDVRVAASTPEANDSGHTFHFCSSSCRDRFVANPKQFLPSK
jgi:protein SCO1